MIPKILIAGIGEEVGGWLEEELDGVEILFAETFPEALSLIAAEPPAMLISSEHVGSGAGESLVEATRSSGSETKIIFCLGSVADPALGRRLVEVYHVDQLLIFPLDRRELLRHSAQLMGLELISARTPSGDSVAAGVAALWDKFRDTILGRVQVLENAGISLLEGGFNADARREAEREAHKLAGSVGTFGFAEASRIARTCEQILGGAEPIQPGDVLRFSDLVVRLRSELEQSGGKPKAAIELPERAPVILILDSDKSFAESLVAAAAERGLRGLALERIGEVRTKLVAQRPDIIVLDMTMDRRPASGASLLQMLSDVEPPIPMIVMGGEESLWDRVTAARMGARSFLEKPVPPEAVIAEAERMLQTLRPQRGRILAVDDDPQILATLESVLNREGFEIETLTDPLQLLARLEEAETDLLILDLDMPHLTGVELCRVVRSDPRWQGLPILVLTAHRESEVVQRVFAAGADDFIVKPIVEIELLTRIANRLERSRLYRSMAETDFLTGIANRWKSSEMIEQLRRLADRHQQPLSFAMLDIDRFKEVNDRFGHATGDRVLRQLAEFLLRTFRGEDVIGRWGGEEFVLGMYGMGRADGAARLQVALDNFRRIPIDDGRGGKLEVTFSAGIALYPDDGKDLQALYRAADGALYQAKAEGRARIAAARPDGAAAPEAGLLDVLLVEDDEALAGLLIHSLQARGYRTQWLQDGKEALGWLAPESASPGARVILLDVDLPGIDGLALLRRLHQSGVTRNSRVVMLTARAAEPEVLEALRTGAFDHVAKPFSVPVLMQRVQRALDG